MVVVPEFAAAQAPARARLDAQGFSLPDGAIARLGDLHFAQRGEINGIVVSADG
jgi:hypothetical protein